MKKRLILVGALLVAHGLVNAQQQESSIEEVQIAGKKAQKLYETGKNVTLLTKEDLENRRGQELSEVLQSVTGIQITGVTNNPQEPKSPKIRGGKLANVLILIDGVPMKDVTGNDYTAMDLRMIPLEAVQSIEVLNGSSSVLYGSNATVSVINIRTDRALNKPITGSVGLSGGSFSTFAQNLNVGGRSGKWTYSLSGQNEKSEGISSAKGEDFDKDGRERQSLTARVGFQENRLGLYGEGGFQNHLYDYDLGAFADSENRGKDKQNFIGFGGNYQYQNGVLRLTTRYSQTNRLLQDRLENVYQDQYQYEGDNLFLELINHYEFSKLFSLSAGISHESQAMGSKALPWGGNAMEDALLKEDTKVNNTDFFAVGKLSVGEFHLDLGGRYTNHSKFGGHFVYSLNPNYLKEVGSHYYKVGYSLSTAFIAPTLYQSYGTPPYTIGNEDLKPETNLTHELNFSIGEMDRRYVIEGALYLRSEKDVFAYVSDENYVGQFVNVNENEVRGFELGGEYQVIPSLRLGANYSFVEKDNALTRLRQPKHRFNSFLNLSLPTQTTLHLSHQWVSERSDSYYDNDTFEVRNVTLDSYHLVNLTINQTIVEKLKGYATIGNLFNTAYTDVAGYSTLPRHFTLGLEYNF